MKNEIREKFKRIRNEIDEKNEKSRVVTFKIIQNKLFMDANVIAVFKSIDSEIDMNMLIDYLLSNGKTVLLPRVYGKELEFYKYVQTDKLIKSKWGIEEPEKKEENYVSKDKIDLAIVPGVCFDRNKNRIGYGGGFYDRFLKNTNIKTIGVCFDEQIYENELPVDNNDIKMNVIITDKEIII